MLNLEVGVDVLMGESRKGPWRRWVQLTDGMSKIWDGGDDYSWERLGWYLWLPWRLGVVTDGRLP